MNQITDMHCHILPGLDDGSKSMEETMEALREASRQGITSVIATPHYYPGRYEPDAGVTRLDTVRVSRASADQRRGRAGRTEPGSCYRLWSEPETAALLPFAEPEIRAADLSGLLLDCAARTAVPAGSSLSGTVGILR